MRYFVNPKTLDIFAFEETTAAAPFIDRAIDDGLVECGRPPALNERWDKEKKIWIIDQDKTAAILNTTKDAMWDRIKEERDRRTQAGGYKVGDHWFHSDAYSISQQLGLTLAAMAVKASGGDLATLVNPTPWKTMDGTKVPMTAALALQLLPAASAQQGSLFAAADNHQLAMKNSPEPSAYDYHSGWPKVFGE